MKISIITATWNSAATLRDTIESVLAQSYDDIEHVIVDGGSKDATLDIVREYEPRYNGRLKWVSEKDRGIYDAMNKGIRLASGDVVGLLNSDDFYTSQDVVSRIAEAFNTHDVAAVYADVHYVNDDDLTKCVRYYSSKGFRRWKMRMGFMPAHPTFYCKKEAYENFGYFDLDFKIAADFENLLRLLFLNRISTVYIPADFVTMRTGGASSSGMASHKRIIRDHMMAYRKNGVYSNYLLESLRYFYKMVELISYRLGFGYRPEVKNQHMTNQNNMNNKKTMGGGNYLVYKYLPQSQERRAA